ncbi:SRPBCC family protein [Rhizomonospora bruguierae]|uniref:SRPBCC family protein n=1 Tax=Rhizomonospora bruguierae TaxID=1581705 RepID=UPI001BCED49B|nr:SRPBCC family protein [Micromonospora sp. NBRC 107566]
MQLEHEFTVPVSVEEAWQVLLDVERVAPCMPGAAVTRVEGDEIDGTVKVKVGPMQVMYRGAARFTERDDEARRVVVVASGKENRGTGTAKATVTGTLAPDGESATRVRVLTDLAITGKPAQLGRGVLDEVGQKLIGRFAEALAAELARHPAAEAAAGPVIAPAPAAATVTPTPAVAPRPEALLTPMGPQPGRPAQDEAIDLLDVGALPVLKRLLVPTAVVSVAVLAAVGLCRRRRRR